MIGAGVHIYICIYVCGQIVSHFSDRLTFSNIRGKKIVSHFSDRLTFSNIRGRTSRRIYGLTLPYTFLVK